MLSSFFQTLQSKLYIAGTAILTVVAFFVRFQAMKNAKNKAEIKADTLKATLHAERVKKKIIKEEKEKDISRRADIHNQIEKLKKGEDFEGIDTLTNPNDDF